MEKLEPGHVLLQSKLCPQFLRPTCPSQGSLVALDPAEHHLVLRLLEKRLGRDAPRRKALAMELRGDWQGALDQYQALLEDWFTRGEPEDELPEVRSLEDSSTVCLQKLTRWDHVAEQLSLEPEELPKLWTPEYFEDQSLHRYMQSHFKLYHVDKARWEDFHLYLQQAMKAGVAPSWIGVSMSAPRPARYRTTST